MTIIGIQNQAIYLQNFVPFFFPYPNGNFDWATVGLLTTNQKGKRTWNFIGSGTFKLAQEITLDNQSYYYYLSVFDFNNVDSNYPVPAFEFPVSGTLNVEGKTYPASQFIFYVPFTKYKQMVLLFLFPKKIVGGNFDFNIFIFDAPVSTLPTYTCVRGNQPFLGFGKDAECKEKTGGKANYCAKVNDFDKEGICSTYTYYIIHNTLYDTGSRIALPPGGGV